MPTLAWGADLKTDPDNGYLVGPDNCHYPNVLQAFYFGKLGFCGCGNPEEEAVFLRDVLALLAARANSAGEHSKYVQKCAEIDALFGGNERFKSHYLYWLDAVELTEHGSNISGSWLSAYGESVLALFQSVDVGLQLADMH